MKKTNVNLSVASIIVFALVGCDSNLNTSQPISPAIAKKQVTAVAPSIATAAANTATESTINMTEALIGSWSCDTKLSAPSLCGENEVVTIPAELQSMDISVNNQEINSDTKNNCNIDDSYKLTPSGSTSGNTLAGTITSTELTLQSSSQNDSSCESDAAAVNKNPPEYAVTFTINSTKTGNTLTMSLTDSKKNVLTKVYDFVNSPSSAAPATTQASS